MIGASDSDRDVLLVKKDPVWARTPVHDWGVMQFDLDAEMDAAGGISGWCRITAEGANAAGHAWRESKSNRQELIRRMQNLLSGYGAGLRVVDVKQQAAWKPGTSVSSGHWFGPWASLPR